MPVKPSLLLVSDNLRRFELLIRAALPNTTIVPVKYESWSLDQLAAAINERVRPGHINSPLSAFSTTASPASSLPSKVDRRRRR